MNAEGTVGAVLGWIAGLPLFYKVILTMATTSFVVEMTLRAWGRSTAAYARWHRMMEAVGQFWTAIILGVVYFVAVQLTSHLMKLFGAKKRRAPRTSGGTFWLRPSPTPPDAPSAARRLF
jgi:hypothetical protein